MYPELGTARESAPPARVWTEPHRQAEEEDCLITEKGKDSPPTIQSVKGIDEFLLHSKGTFSPTIREEGADDIPVLIDSLNDCKGSQLVHNQSTLSNTQPVLSFGEENKRRKSQTHF